MGAIAQVAAGLAAVLLGAWLFTNSLEWFGLRAGISHGALGSVFAALGTALPEASIAVLAALTSSAQAVGDAVSIGAVLGAPLLLATLGFAVLGAGGWRAGRASLQVPAAGFRRDLVFFLAAFGTACVVGVLQAPPALRWPAGAALIAAYAVFTRHTLVQDDGALAGAGQPRPLLVARLLGRRVSARQRWGAIALQLALALGVMLGGAHLFVEVLTGVSRHFRLSGFVLAALIAPLATELPESLNSLVWLGQGKDALAAGNVTGAMVLQGAVIPGIAMWFTPWAFGPAEAAAAGVALVGALLVWFGVRWRGRVPPWLLLLPGLLYFAFVVWVL